MFGKYFSKKQESFYLPGEEIKIDKNFSFKNYTCKKDALSVCKNRLISAVLAFVLIFTIISIRLFEVCVAPNLNKQITTEQYHLQAYANNPIKRADILDRNGSVIATSLPTVNLYANPKLIKNPKKTAQELVKILPELKYNSLYKKLSSNKTFVYLKRNLTPSQQYQINYLGIPGLDFENGEKRIYPHKKLFSHLLGFTNIDNKGIAGIEKAQNERLTQSDIPLSLTIDAGVQYTIHQILSEQMAHFQAVGAAAILMDVDTSEVLSLVSLPDYDPNLSVNPNSRSFFNMTTKGVYEPGSVLKVFNAAMSLESGKVKVADKFDASQPLKLKYNVIKDYRGENRWLSVPEIMIYSSNIGSAQMALKVGGAEQRQFLQKMGFFDELDFEIAEKSKPITPKRWGDGTIATVAYGYGLALSPMHVITAFSSVVNGGVYHEPTILKNSTKKDNGYRVMSYNTSKQMRELLRLVVTKGSAKKANILGYEVAGKTGTANKLSANGKYNSKVVRTTFVATFPVSKPKYALLVMLDEPKGNKETWGFTTSGWNAVPTGARIISAVAPQLNVKANFDLDEARHARIIEASYTKAR